MACRHGHRLAEQQRQAQIDMLLSIEPIHVVCPCAKCVYGRLIRLLNDLDAEYGPPAELESELKKESVH